MPTISSNDFGGSFDDMSGEDPMKKATERHTETKSLRKSLGKKDLTEVSGQTGLSVEYLEKVRDGKIIPSEKQQKFLEGNLE